MMRDASMMIEDGGKIDDAGVLRTVLAVSEDAAGDAQAGQQLD